MSIDRQDYPTLPLLYFLLLWKFIGISISSPAYSIIPAVLFQLIYFFTLGISAIFLISSSEKGVLSDILKFHTAFH